MSFITTGCRTNQADAAAVRAALADLPVRFVAAGAPADVVVVNACTLTRDADRTARAAVNRALRHGAQTVLTGCLATRLSRSDRPEAIAPECRVLPGTSDRRALVDMLRQLVDDEDRRADGGDRQADDGGSAAPADTPPSSPALERARPVIKVQDGCDHACAYCIVPSVRGPATSVPPDAVREAVLRATTSGAAEVVLTGIDLASWGRDLGGRDPVDLLDALLALNTGMRFRLSSIEPHGLEDRLLDRIGTSPDICPQLHVPIQSGSDRILAAMHRRGRTRDLRQRLAAARDRIPGLALGLDVICGFPGETDDDFDQTVALIQAVDADTLHVFPYSPRPGTAAARRPDDVPFAVKSDRVARLRELARTARRRRLASWVGRVAEVVDVGRRPDGQVASIAADGTPVRRDDPHGPRGGRHCVRIHATDGTTAFATDQEHP